MDIHLDSRGEHLIERQLRSGRYHSPAQVVVSALEALNQSEQAPTQNDERRRAVQDMLAFAGERHRQHLTLGVLAGHPDRRVLHGDLRPDVAVDPLHVALGLDPGPAPFRRLLQAGRARGGTRARRGGIGVVECGSGRSDELDAVAVRQGACPGGLSAVHGRRDRTAQNPAAASGGVADARRSAQEGG